jgi:HNH endonuclease
MHYRRVMAGSTRQGPSLQASAEVRFWRHVDKRRADECWPWLSTKSDDGYGKFRAVAGQPKVMAHRYAYELLVGPIPEGLQIDHVRARGCIRKDCVNPAHMEPVTALINNHRSGNLTAVNAAKQTCPRGHEYDRQYTRKDGRRERVCSTCQLETQRRHYARARSRRAS